MTTLLALALLLPVPPPGGGEGEKGSRPAPRTQSLSVREAVSLSLNHNLDIEVARYQPWIEDQNVLAAFGPFDHVLYAGATRGWAQSPGFSSLSGALQLEEDTKNLNAGLRKTLPFGASYDLFYRSDYLKSNNSFLLENPVYTQSAGLGLTLPLMKGWGETANTATLIVARNNRDISVDVFERTVSDSVFLVITAYWDFVFAIENRRVKEQSLEVSRRLLEDNRRKFDRGLASRLDVTQADAGLAAQQEGLLTAEAAVFNAMDRLKRLVDPSLLRQEVVLVPLDAPRGAEAALDERAAVERGLDRARESRPEFREIRRRRSSADVELVRARNDRLPRLDVLASGSVTGTDDAFHEAVKEAGKLDFYDLEAGLLFEWALEGTASRGAEQRLELERRRLGLQERNLENQVLVEIREAVRAIKTNEKRAEATRRARELAQEQLDGELTRNTQGLSTTFRVLDVQEDLALARTNELKALIDYHLSRFKLQQVSGILLGEQGVLVKDNLQPRVAWR
jgi:outer membrane protein TolC